MFLVKLEKVLLFLTLLFLPTQLGKHFWPEFSYIYSLKIDYLSPTIYFWDILVVGLLAVWLLGKPRINKLALSLLFFFLLSQALSLFRAGNLGAGLVRLEQYSIAGFFGVFLASLQNTKFVYLPLLLGITGESLIAILQVIKGSTLGLWILGERAFSISTPGIAKFDFYGMQFLRPYATFPHPNVLAGYLVVLVYSLWSMVYGKKRFLKIISTLTAITVFLTMSRAAILAGAVLLALAVRKKSFIIIMIITVITIILSPVLFTRFSSLLNFDNLTLLRREELIGNAWDLFLKNPLFGAGLNNFIPALSNNLVSGPNRFLQPVHNIVFLALAETGIVGLAGFLVLVGWPVIGAKCNPSTGSTTSTSLSTSSLTTSPLGTSGQSVKSKDLALSTSHLALIITFLGMFDHYFLTLPQGYRLLFLVWGLTMSVKMIK